MLLQQFDNGQRFAQPLPRGGDLLLAHLPAGQAQIARPRLALGQFDARLERHIELRQRQPQRRAIGDAHAAEVEIAILVDKVSQIGRGLLGQVGRWIRERNRLPEQIRIGDYLVDVHLSHNGVSTNVTTHSELPGGNPLFRRND